MPELASREIPSSSAMSSADSHAAVFRLHSFGNPDKSGGSILIIPPSARDMAEAQNLAQKLASDFHILMFGSDLPADIAVFETARRFAAQLQAEKAKRLTVFGISAGTVLAQALCITAPALVRRVALLDPHLSQRKNFKEKAYRFFSKFLPYGLPAGEQARAFDLHPNIHRLRAPALLLASNTASPEFHADIRFMLTRVPNSRQKTLTQAVFTPDGTLSDEVSKAIADFMQVPAKRSQKGSDETEK
jgi:pimeloyl-ACP methyl ester carboxylesterase